MLSSFNDSISRLQRFSKSDLTLTWGVAPGYYISRRWRLFADFCSKAGLPRNEGHPEFVTMTGYLSILQGLASAFTLIAVDECTQNWS